MTRHFNLSILLLQVVWLPMAFAQFGNFFQGNGFHFGGHNPFGGGQQQHEQPQRAHRGWQEMDNVHCGAGYVCPGSLACVPTPADCPCEYPEDVKCVIPDHRERDENEGPPFICVRGGVGCEEVVRFSKPI